MRIAFFLIFCLSAYVTINAQDQLIIDDSALANKKTTDAAPGVNIDISFSTMPGQPMLNGGIQNMATASRLTYNQIKGSPYLNPDFVRGEIEMEDGVIYNNLLLQFDLYSGNVIASDGNGNMLALDRERYNSFLIPHDGEDLLLKKVHPDKPKDYYVVLFENDQFIFFKQKYVTVRESSNYGLAKTDAQFTSRNDYFISKRSKKAVNKIKLKEKVLMSYLSKKDAKAIKEYAEQNGLKLNKEKNFVLAMNAVLSKPKAST